MIENTEKTIILLNSFQQKSKKKVLIKNFKEFLMDQLKIFIMFSCKDKESSTKNVIPRRKKRNRYTRALEN